MEGSATWKPAGAPSQTTDTALGRPWWQQNTRWEAIFEPTQTWLHGDSLPGRHGTSVPYVDSEKTCEISRERDA